MKGLYIGLSALVVGIIAYLIALELAHKKPADTLPPSPTPDPVPSPSGASATPVVVTPAPAPTPSPAPSGASATPVVIPPAPAPAPTPTPAPVITYLTPTLLAGVDGRVYMKGIPAPYDTYPVVDIYPGTSGNGSLTPIAGGISASSTPADVSLTSSYYFKYSPDIPGVIVAYRATNPNPTAYTTDFLQLWNSGMQTAPGAPITASTAYPLIKWVMRPDKTILGGSY